MTEQHFDPAAVERVKAFLDARDRFAASAREQGANPQLNNIAHQADAAAVLAPFYDAYDRPGSASYPLNTDDLQQLLDRLDFRAKEGEQLAEKCSTLRAERDVWHGQVDGLTAKLEAALRALTTAKVRVDELEAEREQDEGDEARGYEWATRTPDGLRTRWINKEEACAFARRHPDIEVDRREVRHRVGAWCGVAYPWPAAADNAGETRIEGAPDVQR